MNKYSDDTGHEGHAHHLTDARVAFLKKSVALSKDDELLLDVVRALS